MNMRLKNLVRKSPHLYRIVRYYLRKIRSHTTGYPDWNELLTHNKKEWMTALERAKKGPKVLLASTDGGNIPGINLESLLAVALTLRGADVEVLLCDSALPACWEAEISWYPREQKFVKNGPRDLCVDCYRPAAKLFHELGIRLHRYSHYLNQEDKMMAAQISASTPFESVGSFLWNGLAVGEHAVAGALRFYAKGSFEEEKNARAVLQRYFEAALLTSFALERLLDKQEFQSVICTHGIYVPFGLISESARKRNIRIVNWNFAYRKSSFIFSHGDTYHHTLMWEPTDRWENISWNEQLEASTLDYLRSRIKGTNDWIWVHDKATGNLDAMKKELGIDFSRPCIGMLTNVVWDAQLHYPANAFRNMMDWAIKTIDYFSRRPELTLLIRVHPAEIRGLLLSREFFIDEIRKHFPILPSNVYLIPPESQIDTYAAMAQCNTVLIYGTKTGVEMTSVGIPVIVAGEAWIRNKGITMDARSVEEYFEMLNRLPLPEKLSQETVQRARKYAFHFFFRRMIPLDFLKPKKGNPPFKIQLDGLDDLKEGKNVGLDVICDGILKGTDFIYPAERLEDRK